MLNSGLVQALLERNILNGGTQVLAEFEKTDNSMRALKLKDYFTIDAVNRQKDGRFLFKLCRLETKEFFLIPEDKVLMVDGMEPKDLAKAFDLNADGSKKVMGKRRGRPRKHFPYGQED